MAKKQIYTVVFEHGDRPNQWVAAVKEVPQCHTFGRGLAQTRAHIREALILWEGDEAESAELREVLPLPAAAKRLMEKSEDLSKALLQLQQGGAGRRGLKANWSSPRHRAGARSLASAGQPGLLSGKKRRRRSAVGSVAWRRRCCFWVPRAR
jgi:predicted RNase H-like HicB family nuclease